VAGPFVLLVSIPQPESRVPRPWLFQQPALSEVEGAGSDTLDPFLARSVVPGAQVRDYGLAGANLSPFHTRNSSSQLLPIHNFPISELALKFPILSLT